MFITPNPFNIHIRPSYPSKLERIPNDSRVDVITIKQTRLNLDMGSFVTLKQFPYKVGGTPTSKPTPLNNATLIPVSSLYLHNPPHNFSSCPGLLIQGDIGLVIAHKPNEQTVDVLLRPLLNNDMSISR